MESADIQQGIGDMLGCVDSSTDSVDIQQGVADLLEVSPSSTLDEVVTALAPDGNAENDAYDSDTSQLSWSTPVQEDELEEEEVIDDQEESEFIETFINLDVNEPGHNIDWGGELFGQPQDGYIYDDFSFFDVRSEEDKLRRKGCITSGQSVCPNQLYFWQRYQRMKEDQSDEAGGFAGLVYRASHSKGGNNSIMSSMTRRKEAKQMFVWLKLMIELPGREKELVLHLQNGSNELYDVFSRPNDVQTRYPTDTNDVRRILIDGKHSIMKNFPAPKVFEINNHACVGLKETILLAAGHGANFNFAWNAAAIGESKRNFEGLNGTRAVHDLVHDVQTKLGEAGLSKEEINKTSIGWIYFWSDSFLRCFVKQRDNSVWILTVTICPPEKEKSVGTFTKVLAMGRSSEDHTKVIEHYIQEYKELMKGFLCYCGGSNDIRRLAFGLLSMNADRPERQMISNTRKEGTYGRLSGWSANPSAETFPDCQRCYRMRIEVMTAEGMGEYSESGTWTCTRCSNWTLDSGSADLVTDPVDENYPKESEVSQEEEPEGRRAGQTLLGPVKLSGSFLTMVVKQAYNSQRSGLWSEVQAKSYLRTCNITQSVIDRVVNLAKQDRKNDQESDPSEYIPKIWSELNIFDRYLLPDLPMHGLAHGIINDVLGIISTIFSHYKKLTAFHKFANITLHEVDSFGLDYCKAKTLPKSAWLGENSMAFMRLMSYIVGMFLSQTKLGTNEDTRTKSNICRLLNALQSLMSVLMSTKTIKKQVIDSYIKLFMSAAHHLHKEYGCLNRTKDADKKGKGKGDELVNRLNRDDLKKILEEFGEDVKTRIAENRIAVQALRVKRLKAMCESMSLTPHGSLKSELQHQVFGNILDRELSLADHTIDVRPKETIENKMCWEKGNWLSFLVNIPGQIEYMGPLPLLW
jgi:hypothetical protein